MLGRSYTFRLPQILGMCTYRCIYEQWESSSLKGSFDSILEELGISLVGRRQRRIVGLGILNKL